MLKADKMAVGKTDNSADFQPTIWRNLRRKAKPATKNGHPPRKEVSACRRQSV